jgi:Bacterial protein of unknown function (Gcw_chp)
LGSVRGDGALPLKWDGEIDEKGCSACDAGICGVDRRGFGRRPQGSASGAAAKSLGFRVWLRLDVRLQLPNFRGITQSAHKPSVAAYFEPRYNISKDLQLYAGVAGESIAFPNRAAMELDVYGGIRPTFDKLALVFGYWFYGYPGGQCFNDLAVGGATCTAASGLQTPLPNGNVVKQDVSFWKSMPRALTP